MDGLRVNYIDIDELIKQHGVEGVFNVEFWRQYCKPGTRNVVIIDECQRYFSSSARHPDSVWYFFEYHRHLGLDIYLCSQSATSVNRRLLAVIDSYIEAQPPSLQVNRILYLRRDSTTNEVISRRWLPRRAEVYRLYKSAEHEDGLKRSISPVLRAGILGIVALVGVIVTVPYVLAYSWGVSLSDVAGSSFGGSGVQSKPVSRVSRPVAPASMPSQAFAQLRRAIYMRPSVDQLPLSCLPYSAQVARCGPYPTTVSDLPGAICNANGCMVYIQLASTDTREGARERPSAVVGRAPDLSADAQPVGDQQADVISSSGSANLGR